VLLGPERQRSFARIPWWFFYAMGALIMIGAPIVVWIRSRIGTAVLGTLVTGRVFQELMVLRVREDQGTAGVHVGFVAIAAIAAAMLWRAVLSRREPPQ